MRELKAHHWLFIVIVVAAVGWMGYELTALVHPNGGMSAPERQPLPGDAEALARLDWHHAPDGHSVLCHPEDHVSGYVYTPHRYPRSVGGEISNAIHYGWSSMKIPNVKNAQWIIAPPSEDAW